MEIFLANFYMESYVDELLNTGMTPSDIAKMIKESDDPFLTRSDKQNIQRALSKQVLKMRDLEYSYSDGSKFE